MNIVYLGDRESELEENVNKLKENMIVFMFIFSFHWVIEFCV